MYKVLWGAGISLLLVGCGGFEAAKMDDLITLPSLVSPLDLESKAMTIIQNRCTPCHSTANVNGGLGDVSNKTYLLAQGWVVPGGAANSVIYDSISKDRMPQGSPLNAEDKAAIRDWIIAGIPQLPIEPISFEPTRTILQARCFTCHSAAGGNLGGINLETFANVKARVVPGKPEQSGLFDSVVKGRMPAGGQMLPLRELATIYSWIYAGAAETGAQ